MTAARKTYSRFQKASALYMVFALLWLTLSMPFVLASQDNVAKQEQASGKGSPVSNDEESSNPLGNNTEEKASSNGSFSEEYLHDHHHAEYILSAALQYHKCESVATYVAYHGELHVPPPNIA